VKRKTDWIAITIEVMVILAAAPRWIPALMRSEGFTIPSAWLPWWIPMSGIMSAAMAVTEAVAIAYVFSAWHDAKGSEARRLLVLTIMLLTVFSFVLTPFIASSIIGQDMRVVLASPGQYSLVLLWSTSVVLSTGFTVMAVGVAQGTRSKNNADEEDDLRCWCGFSAVDESDLDNHYLIHLEEVSRYSSSKSALDALIEKYEKRRNGVLPPLPTLAEVARMKKYTEVVPNDGTS